jgi:hypothetical protein
MSDKRTSLYKDFEDMLQQLDDRGIPWDHRIAKDTIRMTVKTIITSLEDTRDAILSEHKKLRAEPPKADDGGI